MDINKTQKSLSRELMLILNTGKRLMFRVSYQD